VNLSKPSSSYNSAKPAEMGSLLLSTRIAELKPENIPTRATIVDCVDDTRFLVHEKSGSRAKGGADVGRHHTTAVLTLRRGSWYVTSYILKEAGTC
ncbi:hypothetical protein ACFSKW_26815, partial [Nonomuraea mangrovi]